MNIMHRKTVENDKNLLRNYVTRRKGERRNTNKRSIQISELIISHPKLDKFQLQC